MHMKFISRVLVIAFALLLTAYIIPGITVAGIYPAIIAGLFLGLVNALVRPVLIVLTLPVTILTLGLFVFVINGLLFYFVASFVDGFSVSGFWSAFFGSIVVSVISSILNKL